MKTRELSPLWRYLDRKQISAYMNGYKSDELIIVSEVSASEMKHIKKLATGEEITWFRVIS